MSTPRVSVILPTYNRAPLLATAMDSILLQTFRDFELIVVDDGSADHTEALVRRYQDADGRVKYIRKENGGISSAMNAGLRAARGQLIARLDSDDRWLPELLEIEVSILDARPEIDLVYSKGQWALADLTPQSDTIGHALHFPEDALRSMLWADSTCNITVVVRRECFDRAGFYDETLSTSEDWDMWLRISLDSRFFFVDRVLAHVRSHEGSATGKTSLSFAAFLKERNKVLDKFFARSDLPPRIAAMRNIAYRNLYIFIGNMWIGARRPRRALGSFVRAFSVGGNPIATAARIAWFGVVVRLISQTSLGRAVLVWESNRRLRRR